MHIDVALLPGQARADFDWERAVCVVVDVLRASSSIVALLERGAAEVLQTQRRRGVGLHTGLSGRLLCEEEDASASVILSAAKNIANPMGDTWVAHPRDPSLRSG